MLNYTRVRNRRERLGLSQRDLEDVTGIRSDIISRIENGHRVNLTLDTLERLAQGLYLRTSDLIVEPEGQDIIVR